MGGKVFNTEYQEATNDRMELDWTFGTEGKPAALADLTAVAENVRVISDRHFEIVGTNHSSDDTTFFVEGGIQLQTDGAGNDQVIIAPHLLAQATTWASTTWGTDRETEWECWIASAGTVAGMVIWAGLKITNTSVMITDLDQAFFRYEDIVAAGNWQAIYSINGADTAVDTGVLLDVATRVHLKIVILPNRIAQFYIDDALVATSTALTDAIDLIPYIGVEDTGAAARILYAFRQKISRRVMPA